MAVFFRKKSQSIPYFISPKGSLGNHANGILRTLSATNASIFFNSVLVDRLD